MSQKTNTVNTQIEGRRSIKEALIAGRELDKMFVLQNGDGLSPIIRQAKDAGVVVVECDRTRLDKMSQTGSHQGIIATIAGWNYAQPNDIFSRAEQKGEKPFIVVCDGVEDEGNLGAIIRSAESAGAHGLVIPKRRSASLSSFVAKASAGAIEHLPVVRVPGIPSYLKELKEKNIWIYGADASGKNNLFNTDFSGGVAIVVGSEGEGMSKLTKETCDFLVSIPMLGKVSSLNVSAATAVLLYQVVKSRLE